MNNFTEYGLQLVQNGYRLIPIPKSSKAPREHGWASIRATANDVRRWGSNGYSEGNIGILTASTPAVDIDVLDKETSLAMQVEVEKIIGVGIPMLVRIGRRPKRLLLFNTPSPFRKIRSQTFISPDGKSHAIEVLGDGQQFVGFGIHPDTGKPFEWISDDSPLTTHVDDLPTITEDIALEIVERFRQLALEKGWAPVGSNSLTTKKNYELAEAGAIDIQPVMRGVTTEKFRKWLALIPNLEHTEFDQWIMIGMGLHHQFQGSDEGFQLWNEWSSKGVKHKKEQLIRRWPSFAASRDHGYGPVTARYIYKLAKQCLHEEKEIEDTLTVREWVDVVKEWKAPRLRELNPEIDWAVEGLVMAGKAGVLVAAGGTGKTTVLLHLGICHALGLEFFGHQCKQGTFMLLSKDDPQEDLEIALAQIMREWEGGLSESQWDTVQRKLRIISFQGFGARSPTMAEPDPDAYGEVKATDFAQLLITELKSIDDLVGVALDTLRQFAGGSSNDEQVIKHVVSAATEIAQATNAAVWIPHHTGKQSYRERKDDMYCGSGSAAIADNCRFVLLLQSAEWSEIDEKVERTGQESGDALVLTSTRGNLRTRACEPIFIARKGYRLTRVAGKVLTTSERERSSARKLLQALDDLGGCANRTAICEKAGGRQAEKHRIVNSLIETGQLNIGPDGTCTLPFEDSDDGLNNELPLDIYDDKIDRKIISAFEILGISSKEDIAKRVGGNRTNCFKHIKKLIESGVLRQTGDKKWTLS